MTADHDGSGKRERLRQAGIEAHREPLAREVGAGNLGHRVGLQRRPLPPPPLYLFPCPSNRSQDASPAR